MPFGQKICIAALLLLLVACNSSSAATQHPTPVPPPTPTVVQLTSDLIAISARPLPVSSDERWSNSVYRIQVRVDNLTTSELVAEVLATSSADFMFVIPEQERTQTLQNNNHTIRTQITLIPKTNDQASYREIVFECVQTQEVISGTHNFTVQVTPPGRDPLRIALVFDVLEKVSLARAQPEDATAPSSNPSEGSCPANTIPYVIRRGDTLNKISALHGTTNSKIMAANNQKIPNPNALRIGVELCIPLSA